ncbi:MAG: RES family NAD+ phosphorylase [Candidatus Melainabacteria bacterium]|nr:RES family NAD+ phosphorylase [Candidatus Melainabacteria bacterium]
MNTGALYTIATKPINGTFFRYIRTKYGDEPLAVIGSLLNGGRYNVAGLFGALYLGFDHETCQAEVSDGIAAGVPFKKGAFTAWDYSVYLSAIVRLDSQSIQNELQISKAQITERGNHWTASGIGEHLHKRGDVDGLVAPSAHHVNGLCLDVFLDRINAPSHVTTGRKLLTWP